MKRKGVIITTKESEEKSDCGEPRYQDVLGDLSQAKSDSKNILFWMSRAKGNYSGISV